MKILIIGKNGFIARSLYELFKENKYNTFYTSQKDLNFLNRKQIEIFKTKIENGSGQPLSHCLASIVLAIILHFGMRVR